MKIDEMKKPTFVSPAKARAFSKKRDSEIWTDPNFIMEEKFDGFRHFLTKDVQWSSTGKDREVPFLDGVIPEGWMLDGELQVTSNSIGEDGDECRSHEVGHYIVEDQSKLEYVVFDILWANGMNIMRLSYKNRRRILEKFFSLKMQEADRIRLVETYNGSSPRKEMYDTILERGGEGVIFKKVEGPYVAGSRAQMVKVKGLVTYDVIVTDANAYPSEWRVRPGEKDVDGIMQEEGVNTEPWDLGYRGLSYGYYDLEGNIKVVGTLGWTDEPPKLVEYIGKVVEMKSFGPRYKTGALRHPKIIKFRDDKFAKECIFDFKRGIGIEEGLDLNSIA